MYRKLCLLPMFAFVASTVGIAAAEPEPGLYRVTAGVRGQDLPAGLVSESTEQCLTREELTADPASVLGNQAEIEGCTIASHEWGDGKIRMQMQCAAPGGDATAESRGTYDANGYELVTVMRINVGNTTVDMESFVRGERIGDC